MPLSPLRKSRLLLVLRARLPFALFAVLLFLVQLCSLGYWGVLLVSELLVSVML